MSLVSTDDAVPPDAIALRDSAPGQDQHAPLLGLPLQALVQHSPTTMPWDASVRDVARTMRDHNVSSILLVQDGQLKGLVTDRDLRDRVVAEGLALSRPAADIASLNPMRLDQRSPAFEALLLMTRHNIHHVPVMDGQRLVGMVTATDLIRQQGTSPLYLARDIHRQTTLEVWWASVGKLRACKTT